MWAVNKEKTEEHWLEVNDPEGWYSAIVKWDGCIHFNRYYNEPMGSEAHRTEDEDYIHICDIDDMIARLESLREMARRHFAENYPHEWGNPPGGPESEDGCG